MSILLVSQNCYNDEMTSCVGNTWSPRDVWVSSACGAFVLVFGKCVSQKRRDGGDTGCPGVPQHPTGSQPTPEQAEPLGERLCLKAAGSPAGPRPEPFPPGCRGKGLGFQLHRAGEKPRNRQLNQGA